MENYKYPEDWSYKITESESNPRIIRANLTCEDHALSWVKKFGNLNRTEWIRNNPYRSNKTPKKYISHRRWLCQHSNRFKQLNSPKTTGCSMAIDIKIKLLTAKTKRTDSYLKLTPPLQAVIQIEGTHNHPTDTAESLNFLQISNETKAQYNEYFHNGLGPTEALRYHEAKLRQSGAPVSDFANCSINPTLRMVRYVYDNYKNETFGNLLDPLQKLKEQQTHYEELGVTLKTIEDDGLWSILIVTPIMKRAQTLSSAGEIIFVDSTSGLETYMTTTTVILAATKAGGIPLALLIHNTQSNKGYKQAFQLLNKSFPLCFYGKQAPDIFMTDDSAAEKLALRTVFPSAKQLLCHFHVLQAEWRWLIANSKARCRMDLMLLFQAIVRARSEDELTAATDKALMESREYPDFGKRLINYLKRKNEWVMAYRLNDSSVRAHNTNNLAEACIRIIKDVVLQRRKARNVLELAKFIATEFENCLITRIVNLAFGRSKKNVCVSTEGMNVNSILKLGDTRFEIPSMTSSDIYEISSDMGICTCYKGQQGAFCKHQFFIYESFNIPFPNLPIINPEERHALAQLALGDDTPPLTFFLKFGTTIIDTIPPPSTAPELTISSTSEEVIAEIMIVSDESAQVNVDEERLKFVREAEEAIQKFSSLISQIPVPADNNMKWLASIRRDIAKLESLKTPEQYTDHVINGYRSDVTKHRRRGMIKVQPTSIARRRVGLPRGSQRIPAGRPKKRPHNISLNIRNNEPSAKPH